MYFSRIFICIEYSRGVCVPWIVFKKNQSPFLNGKIHSLWQFLWWWWWWFLFQHSFYYDFFFVLLSCWNEWMFVFHSNMKCRMIVDPIQWILYRIALYIWIVMLCLFGCLSVKNSPMSHLQTNKQKKIEWLNECDVFHSLTFFFF